MNPKKRPALFFIFTALLVTVCRCQPNVFGNRSDPIVFSDGTSAGSCSLFVEYFEVKDNPNGLGSQRVWACEVPCPDGSISKFDLNEQPRYVILAESAEEKVAFQAQYCSPEAMVAVEPEPSPTEESPAPTEPPAADPAPEVPIVIPPQNLLILQPYLTGGVTACDTGLQYINFPIMSPVQDLTGKKLTVLLNGVQTKCAVASNNSGILACTLLKDTVFPLKVQVKLDDVEINNFTFDGAICTRTVPAGEPDDSPTQPPIATEPPATEPPATVPPDDNTNGSP